MAKIEYHKSHSFVDLDGKVNTFNTQLYTIGVYGILNNDSSLQGNFTPQQIKKLEKELKTSKDNNMILSYELKNPITVSDETGFWVEVI